MDSGRAMPGQQDKYAHRQNVSVLSSSSYRLVRISQSNIRHLLSTASALSQSRQLEAAAILSRLKDLNPDIAKQFHPKLDALSQPRLRLICTLVSPCGTVPSFIAVSYCWHSPEWVIASAAKPIVPGWKISKPMVEAVTKFRVSEDEGIWLDQLCINQKDKKDKKIHIGAMDIIYRSSRRVLILLEDIQLTKEEEDAGQLYAEFYENGCREVRERKLEGKAKEEFVDQMFPCGEKKLRDEGKSQQLAAIKPFALKLLGARWFSRAWCAHESRLAPYARPNNPLFLCYGHLDQVISFEFRFIHYLSYYLTAFLSEREGKMIDPVSIKHSLNDPDPTSLVARTWRIQRLLATTDPLLSPMQHLVNVLYSRCSQKGDLISIALNTSNIPLYYDGNLTKLEDVVWIFSLLVLATGDVVPLVVKGSKLRIKDKNGKETLSWAIYPDLSILDASLRTTASCSITEVTCDYIELDLLIFTSLPSTPTAESLDLSSRIITQHKLEQFSKEFFRTADHQVRRTVETMIDPMTNASGGSQSDGQRIFTRFYRVWLAQAVDCGLDWILRFPEALRKGTDQTWMYGTMGLASDARLTEAANTLISYFHDKGGEGDPIQTANQLATVVRFFMCLLDPRLFLLRMTPRRLPVGPGDFAITDLVLCRLYIAIPAAIAHLPPWQTRAWVIEPFDPRAKNSSTLSSFVGTVFRRKGPPSTADSVPYTSDDADMRALPDKNRTAWQLRRRQIIVGCQAFHEPIAADGVSTILLRKQRVYGAEDYVW